VAAGKDCSILRGAHADDALLGVFSVVLALLDTVDLLQFVGISLHLDLLLDDPDAQRAVAVGLEGSKRAL